MRGHPRIIRPLPQKTGPGKPGPHSKVHLSFRLPIESLDAAPGSLFSRNGIGQNELAADFPGGEIGRVDIVVQGSTHQVRRHGYGENYGCVDYVAQRGGKIHRPIGTRGTGMDMGARLGAGPKGMVEKPFASQ